MAIEINWERDLSGEREFDWEREINAIPETPRPAPDVPSQLLSPGEGEGPAAMGGGDVVADPWW